MSTMERILRLMAEKKASDVYLSANAPALIKINGECVPINNQVLPPDAPKNLLAEIVPPDRIEELEETGELNMGVPLTGVGRFRVSAMRQRGSYAVVVRFIAQHIPELATLLTRYLSDEACGKTIPCRIGLRRLAELGDGLCNGLCRPSDPALIRDLAADVRDGGLCGLEVGGINPLLSGMRYFGSEFDAAVAPGSAQPASAAQRGTNA